MISAVAAIFACSFGLLADQELQKDKATDDNVVVTDFFPRSGTDKGGGTITLYGSRLDKIARLWIGEKQATKGPGTQTEQDFTIPQRGWNEARKVKVSYLAGDKRQQIGDFEYKESAKPFDVDLAYIDVPRGETQGFVGVLLNVYPFAGVTHAITPPRSLRDFRHSLSLGFGATMLGANSQTRVIGDKKVALFGIGYKFMTYLRLNVGIVKYRRADKSGTSREIYWGVSVDDFALPAIADAVRAISQSTRPPSSTQ